MKYDVLKRFDGNPILTAEMLDHVPGGCNSVFNSAIVPFGKGFKGILRVEERSGLQSLRVAESKDGVRFKVLPERVLLPETDEQRVYEEAIYDPRITRIGETYFICYAAESKYGCQVALASTEDFKKFKRHGCIAETENRNLVLFPEKIDGKYYRLDRPFQGRNGNIWMNESPDLVHWGRPRCIMESRNFHWDRGKIGAGAPPIRTKEGWLVIYHGTTPLCNGLIYRLGVALLDLEKPWIVRSRAKAYILSPKEDYERIGDTPNVCFVNSAIPFFERDELWIYYGGADQCLCLAKCRISELVEFCKTM